MRRFPKQRFRNRFVLVQLYTTDSVVRSLQFAATKSRSNFKVQTGVGPSHFNDAIEPLTGRSGVFSTNSLFESFQFSRASEGQRMAKRQFIFEAMALT